MKKSLLGDKIISALNDRINQEEFSSRLYKHMALWLTTNGYSNLASLYNKYAKEERDHSQWAMDYLTNYNILPTLKVLASPVMEFTCCKDLLEATLEHELEITRQCESLYDLATKENKPSLQELALRYCKEQDEEISKSLDLLDHANLTEDMLVLDHYVEKYL